MHHTLRLYSENRKGILRVYMFFAGWAKVPVIGRVVRYFANAYGRNLHAAYLLTPAEAEQLVAMAGGVAVGPCDCRQTFNNCDNPKQAEILLGPVRHVFLKSMPHDAREVSREEATELLRDCHKRGLIQTIIKCKGDFYAICNCCSCCCVPLRMSKLYGIGDALRRHKDIIGEFRDYLASYREG